MLPPLFYAAFKFDRRVYRSPGIICACIASWVLCGTVDAYFSSFLTLAIFMTVSMLAAEIIGRMKIQRDRAAAAVGDREERYRRIVETAREGIWVIDAEADTIWVNNRIAEMLGYTIEEMQGRSGFDFMDEEGRLEAARRFERRREGIGEQNDFRFLRKDGSELWTIVSANPAFDEDGRFAGALAMITDVTERKRTEDALRRSRAELRALAAHLQSIREEKQTVIDGIGHGQFATKATQSARRYVETHFDQALDHILRGVGRACRATRGVGITLA